MSQLPARTPLPLGLMCYVPEPDPDELDDSDSRCSSPASDSDRRRTPQYNEAPSLDPDGRDSNRTADDDHASLGTAVDDQDEQSFETSARNTDTDVSQNANTNLTASSLPVATGWGDYEDAAASWLMHANTERVKSFLLSNPPGNAGAYPRGTDQSSHQKQWRRNVVAAIATTLRTSGVSSDKTCTQNGGAFEKANWPTLIFLSNLQEYASEPHRLAGRVNSDFDPVITADNHARAKAKVVFLPADR